MTTFLISYDASLKMLKILNSAKISIPAASAMFKYLMIGNGSVTKTFFSFVLLAGVPADDLELFILIIN